MKLTAIVTPCGGWLAIEVPEIPGLHTQARTLDEVEGMVRDAASMLTGDAESDFDVTVKMPSTEFEEKREALAKSLFELYHGPDTWETVGAEGDYRFNYRLDAEEVLVMQPHLLSASERVRLWREGREWIEAIVRRPGSQLSTSSLTQWELFYEEMREAVEE